MPRYHRPLLPLLALAALSAGPVLAAEEVSLLTDMTSVIMLLGLPCGQVVKATNQAKDDHIAVCENEMSYRVFVNAQGRVVAERR